MRESASTLPVPRSRNPIEITSQNDGVKGVLPAEFSYEPIELVPLVLTIEPVWGEVDSNHDYRRRETGKAYYHRAVIDKARG